MDFFNSSSCNLCRKLLSIVGLWPYQNSRKFFLYRVFLSTIFSMAVCVQCLSVLTLELTLDFIIDCLPIAMIPGGCVIIIWNRYVNFDTMKSLLEQMRNDWHNAKSQVEIEIMHTYLDVATRLNLMFSVYTLIAVSSFILSTFASQILDIILPLNESRPKIQPFQLEIFIDQQQHFNAILTVVHVVTILAVIILLGNHSIFILYIHHACGMFAVLRHRFEQTLYHNGGVNADKGLNRYTTFRRVGFCIMDHVKVIQLANAIDACYSKYFLFIVTGSILIFSLLLIHVLTLSSTLNRKIRSTAFVIGHLVYMFINSYMGQKLMDMSSGLSSVVYGGHWYDGSMASQKLLILVILKCAKPSYVSVGNFYALSFEKFTMVLQTTVSYCMIIRQLQ